MPLGKLKIWEAAMWQGAFEVAGGHCWGVSWGVDVVILRGRRVCDQKAVATMMYSSSNHC